MHIISDSANKGAFLRARGEMPMETMHANSMTRRLQMLENLPLPSWMRTGVLSFAAGSTVPYLSTSSISLEGVTSETATLRIPNRRGVQNHMGTVHAGAMYLLAEAATGTVLLANLPDRSRYSVTTARIEYVARATGSLRAVATLDSSHRERLRTEAKGRLVVPVSLTDETGSIPARFEIEWSWKHYESRQRRS